MEGLSDSKIPESVIIPEGEDECLNGFREYLDELQKSYINALDPNIFKYLPEITINKNSYHDTKECTICMNEIQIKEKAIILPCLHIFHSDCIKNNFKRNNTCPNCNFKLTSENMKLSALSSVIMKNDNNKIKISNISSSNIKIPNDDISNFNLLGENNSYINLKKSKSDVTNKAPLIKEEESEFCLFNQS